MSGTLHLLARLGGQAIAVPAEMVESVVDIDAVVPAPRSHPAVRGLAALRSRVVTVVDTWQLLDLPAGGEGTQRAIITVVDGHHHAMLVEALEDVAPIDVLPIPTGLALGARWSRVATGSAERDGEPLLVIDLAALVGAMADDARD
ncbi:chemotaxis protein CheW [Sphingomonas sp.]|jgi:purine-binding chemotaxis protein CheW|uniref:chemotaxis protein CheW n=1 Tax=Sphingomonas sp. TaxID=28214 RepID=UPI0026381A5B|nr:chemotaxis protein CheW [Sphingomonas sp.]MDF2604116.1 chemotaxis protein CheW [Sphingomonas sp.]